MVDRPDLGDDPGGILRFASIDGKLAVAKLICRKLPHGTPGLVFLVIDGHPVHRFAAGQTVCHLDEGRLRLCFLKPYSLMLNPA
jgi:hypothetical protein